jgi:hypothetical protein
MDSVSATHTLTFGQSWQPALSPGFNPGEVEVVRRGEILEVTARLTDPAIFDLPAEFNESAYIKCDVFELFILAVGDEFYHEIHVTPSNTRLQLRFSRFASRPFKIKEALVWESLIETSTERVEGGWVARYRCPLANLTSLRPIPKLWKIACGRYDYCGEGKRNISNTAPLPEADFHLHDHWTVVDLG